MCAGSHARRIEGPEARADRGSYARAGRHLQMPMAADPRDDEEQEESDWIEASCRDASSLWACGNRSNPAG